MGEKRFSPFDESHRKIVCVKFVTGSKETGSQSNKASLIGASS